jgi:hypothetical protein
MVEFKPSERELIIYPDFEYRKNILDANLLSIYDESAKAREQHDKAVEKARELPLGERVEKFKEIYGREDYGERRGRGTYRR